MSERVASWFAILMMLVVLGSSYWYSQSLEEQGREGTGRIGEVDFFAEHIAITGFDDLGRGHYRLFADRMTHYANSDDVDLLRPRLMSIEPDRPVIQATALTGVAYNNAQTVRMDGKVVVTRAPEGDRPPMRLETEELYAAPDDDHLWTEEPVVMHSGEAVVHATGMDYDNIERRMELRAQVSGTFPPRKKS